ncbi:MAG TPA: FHA domain-containing protein [Planctomycetaceae bacterium]|jgi:adenylate cyclase
MYGQLVPCGGGSPIPLLKPRLTVGRSAECDIPIPGGTISSKHCFLEQRGGVWYVNDLASRNGIRIDGVRCQEGQLPPGCVLWIAQQRYQVEYKAAGRETLMSSRSITTQGPRDAATPDAGRKTVAESPVPRPAAAQNPAAPPSHPKPGVSLGELVPCGGGVPIPLLKPSLLVGRSPACDITLESPLVSSKHCQLEFKSGFWHVRDLGSRNGIRVGGIVQLAKFLKPGDILSIAKLRYEIDYTPLSDELPPEENPFALSLLEKAGLAGRGAAVESRFPREEAPSPDDGPMRKKWKIDE